MGKFTQTDFLANFALNLAPENVRKSIKSLKDSDFSQVSNKTQVKFIPPSDCHPGPGNMGQNGLKSTPLVISPTKN